MKLNNLFSVLLAVTSVACGQPAADDSLLAAAKEPKEPVVLDSYLFPVKPGEPGQLAGTMAELRTSHLHGGIDIRTNNLAGIPVQATQSGYVERISVKPNGYGQLLVIRHPDGNSSWYGHLERYAYSIENYARRQQRKTQQNEIEIVCSPGLFEVKKGDTVAFVGDTGDSDGPHLHFEIRNAQNELLNPLQFGFCEIEDRVHPVPQRIAFQCMNADSRINHQFAREELVLAKSKPFAYKTSALSAHGLIGVEIAAFDYLISDSFHCGINYIEMYHDGVKLFSRKIESLPYASSREMENVMDVEENMKRRIKFQKLYIDDGNQMSIYDHALGAGFVKIHEGRNQLTILLKDFAGNVTSVEAVLEGTAPAEIIYERSPKKENAQWDLFKNTLKLTAPADAKEIEALSGQTTQKLKPAYSSPRRATYLIDMRKLPDLIVTPSGKMELPVNTMIPSHTPFRLSNSRLDINFSPTSLYDTLYLKTEFNGKRFEIGKRSMSLREPLQITYFSDSLTAAPKQAVYANGAYCGGTFANGSVTFETRWLGKFWIQSDHQAPVVRSAQKTPRSFRCRIFDNLSGIAKYNGYIDGKWALMYFDQKSRTLSLHPSEITKPLGGTLDLLLEDRAGNAAVYHYILGPSQKQKTMKPTIGKPAPDFTINDELGNPVTLSAYRGKKVVLYFYPRDQTPGCTEEACNLRDNYSELLSKGYVIFGISTDGEESHRKFIEKENLPFRLLADVNKIVHMKYHTWVDKQMFGKKYMGTARVTFIVNEEGIVEDIIEKVDTKNHSAQILSR